MYLQRGFNGKVVLGKTWVSADEWVVTVTSGLDDIHSMHVYSRVRFGMENSGNVYSTTALIIP